MKKIDNFTNALCVLKKADFEKTSEDEIYRMGVIEQFNLSFELAWKAMKEVLRIEGVSEAGTGSPRDILKLAYKHGFFGGPRAMATYVKKTKYEYTYL